MHYATLVILFVTAIFGFISSANAYLMAQSAIHEIYAAMSMLVAVTSIAGIGIISAVRSLETKTKKKKDIKNKHCGPDIEPLTNEAG